MMWIFRDFVRHFMGLWCFVACGYFYLGFVDTHGS